jgi:hypothetical protein
MLTGYISDHFKIEKCKRSWSGTEESIKITQTDVTFGLDVNRSKIDELISLLEKSKELFE